MDGIAENRRLLLDACGGMSDLVIDEFGVEIDFITTVGEGANAYRSDLVDMVNFSARSKRNNATRTRGIETSYVVVAGVKQFFIKPEFKYIQKAKSPKKVVVAEDVLNHYTNSGKVCDLFLDMGFEVLGIVAILNRSGIDRVPETNIRGKALVNHLMQDYKPHECLQCKAGIPITKK